MKKVIGIISTNYSSDKFGLLTKERPIASLPFGGRYRLIDFPLSNMVNAGIHNVGIITPHLYRSLVDHVGSGKVWNLNRKNGGLFILPGTTYGYDVGDVKVTLRDIISNLEFVKNTYPDYVIISAANKVYNIDYQDVLKNHEESGAGITLCYKKVENEALTDEFAIDIYEDDQVKDIKKVKRTNKTINEYIDTMVINGDLLMKIIDWYKNQSYMDVMEVIKENIKHFTPHTYEFKGYVKSINDIRDYIEGNKELLDEKVIEEIFMGKRKIITKIHDAHPVKYGEKADIKNSIIATGTVINGKVKDSVLHRDCVIEDGASVENCVLMAKTHISKNVHLENVICDKSASINEGVTLKGTKEKPIIITRAQM